MVNFCLVGNYDYLVKKSEPLIRSLNYHHPGCKIHMITMDKEVQNESFLEADVKVHVVPRDFFSYECYKGTSLEHITMDSFLKIFIFDVLPKEKFIYLDVDTICCGSLSDLLEIDAPFIATEDMWAWKYEDGCHDPSQSIGHNWKHIKSDEVRFSTGMFCVDLADPSMNLFAKFIGELSNKPNCDAVLFNRVIKKYYSIPQKYDFCVSYIDGAINDGYYAQALSVLNYVRENRHDFRLIHYPGPNKPWNTKFLLFKDEWDKYK